MLRAQDLLLVVNDHLDNVCVQGRLTWETYAIERMAELHPLTMRSCTDIASCSFALMDLQTSPVADLASLAA